MLYMTTIYAMTLSCQSHTGMPAGKSDDLAK